MSAIHGEYAHAEAEPRRRFKWNVKRTVLAGMGAATLGLAASEYANVGATEYDLTDWRNASQTSCATPASERYFTFANIAPRIPTRERVAAVERLAERYPNTKVYVGATPLQRFMNALVRSEPGAHYVPFFGENRIYINEPPQDGNGRPLLTERILDRVVAELAHVEQARREGRLSYALRSAREIAWNTLSGRPYSALRTDRRSFEYEAHDPENGIEPRLRDEIERRSRTEV